MGLGGINADWSMMFWICYCDQDTKFPFLRKGDLRTVLTRLLDLRADAVIFVWLNSLKLCGKL
jgi:hypothetical protein